MTTNNEQQPKETEEKSFCLFVSMSVPCEGSIVVKAKSAEAAAEMILEHDWDLENLSIDSVRKKDIDVGHDVYVGKNYFPHDSKEAILNDIFPL